MALFAWSFLAATLIPLGSEFAFLAVILRHEEVVFPVLVATTGNSLGAFTTYWLGARAAQFASGHGAVSGRARRARDLLRRHGHAAAFFSWVPVLGDALVAAAGAARMAFVPFAAWVVVGKGFRYLVLAWSAGNLDSSWLRLLAAQ